LFEERRIQHENNIHGKELLLKRDTKTRCKLFKRLTRLDSGFLENENKGTEACKRRLQKVRSYKSGEPKPVGVMKICKQKARKHKYTGNGQYETINIHTVLSIY
jgi:hypothetical protein